MQWARPGLLCIGDAAHAMSPVGGVASTRDQTVAAANILSPVLQKDAAGAILVVQKRRQFPTKVIQASRLRRIRCWRQAWRHATPRPPLFKALNAGRGCGTRRD